MIIDKLIEKIKCTENPVCVGLDTCVAYMPSAFADKYDISTSKGCAQAVYDYNTALIDALYKDIPSVKLQNAYYEMYGIGGIEVYKKTINYAQSKGLIVIADVKCGDIGSTSAAYAAAHIGKVEGQRVFAADIMTVNPYFGVDGTQPFIDDCKAYDKGIFVLVKTSNPSSSQLQDQELKEGGVVYEKVADLVKEWGQDTIGVYGYSAIGAVVGATHREQGEALRKRMKNTFFLIPGYGAQGAGADDLAGMFDKKGLGGIVNSSRGILCAWKKAGTGDFVQAAVDAVNQMKNDINRAIAAKHNL